MAGTLFQTVTKRVTVSDGLLTLSPTGGSNTKIDYVDVVQAPPLVDTTPPTASIALAGTVVSGTTYTGTVTATVTAADDTLGTGIKTVTYSLDGGSDTPYTVPVAVSDVGPHTLAVTATDNSNNVFHTSASWTINAPPPPDTTNPTASIVLAGSTDGTIYTGDVTATVTAADEVGGSGLKSVTYILDGGAVTPYTVPVVVHAAGNHTLSVTATDNANNTFTTVATWTSQLVDNTPAVRDGHLGGHALQSRRLHRQRDGHGCRGRRGRRIRRGVGQLRARRWASTPYTTGILVTALGSHTLTVTVTDNQNNVGHVTKTWSQQGPDVTKPTASIALGGSTDGTTYTGDVTATVTAADEVGGSGVKSVVYSLDGATAIPYTGPITVTATGAHSITVTVTDNANNIGTASTSWNQQAAGTPHLTVTSSDSTVLGLTAPRLVFSAVRGLGATDPRSFTFTNDGTSALTVSNLAFAGTNANNWKLAAGQASSLVIPAGSSAAVSIQFVPTDPTGCADSNNVYAIGDVARNATLTYSTNDPTQATGSSILSGVNSCYVGGNNEPVLDQLIAGLGYTDTIVKPGSERRYIGRSATSPAPTRSSRRTSRWPTRAPR